MEQRHFNNFTELLNLFLATTDVRIRDVRLLLHGHHSHRGVDLGRQRDLNLIFVAVHTRNVSRVETVKCVPYTHALLNIGGRSLVTKSDDKLCDLLHVDDILGLVLLLVLILCSAILRCLLRSGVDNLGASCNLERLLLL